MKRRGVIASFGCGTVGWSLVARAQHTKVHRIGALVLGNADAESFQAELRQELRKSGYVEGQNVLLDIRSAQGNLAQLPQLAAELVALKVDVIVAIYTP